LGFCVSERFFSKPSELNVSKFQPWQKTEYSFVSYYKMTTVPYAC